MLVSTIIVVNNEVYNLCCYLIAMNDLDINKQNEISQWYDSTIHSQMIDHILSNYETTDSFVVDDNLEALDLPCSVTLNAAFIFDSAMFLPWTDRNG